MSLRVRTFVDKQQIRDTNAFNSNAVDLAASPANIIVDNGLDQNVGVQLQGSIRGSARWTNIGTSQTVSTDTLDAFAITDPWPLVRAVITASVSPATGDISAHATYQERS